MTFWQAIILGLVQGFTEFLPISSSGHLLLLEKFFENSDGSLSFEIALHLATLLAVLIFFWPTITSLSKKTLLLLLVASTPLIPVVFFVHQFLNSVSQSITWIAFFLLITATVNYLSYLSLRKKSQELKTKHLEKITVPVALKIGFFQTLGVLPGVSRSGITLCAALSSQIASETAFQFSFLLSIPAIVGAVIFDIFQSNGNNLASINWSLTLPAMLVAFVSGLLSLKILKGVLNNNRFLLFALYCLMLGGSLLFFN